MAIFESQGPTWHEDLVEIILGASDGDTIIVPDTQASYVARDAVRVVRPKLQVTLEIKKSAAI